MLPVSPPVPVLPLSLPLFEPLPLVPDPTGVGLYADQPPIGVEPPGVVQILSS